MAYRPWAYVDRRTARQQQTSQFRQRAEMLRQSREARASVRPAVAPQSAPAPKKDDGGGGFWSRAAKFADAVTPDALEGGVKKGLEILDMPREYVGGPAFSVLSGQTGVEPVWDEERQVWYRPKPGFGDMFGGIKEALTQDPRKTYTEARVADEQRIAAPDMNRFGEVLMSGASDPLTWIGPGAVRAGLKFLPAAAQTSRGARFAGAVLESPRSVSAGGVVGSALAAEGAEQAGLPRGLQTAATIAGGFGGGIGGGLAARRGYTQITRDMQRQAARFGLVPEGGVPGGFMVKADDAFADDYADALGRHGIEFSYGEDGRIVLDDPDAALAKADEIEFEAERAMLQKEEGAQDGGRRAQFTGMESNQTNYARRERKAKNAAKEPAAYDPAYTRDRMDAARIRDVASNRQVDTVTAESARRDKLARGSKLTDRTVITPERRVELEKAKSSRREAGNQANRSLGAEQADTWIEWRVENGDYTPAELADQLRADLINRNWKTGNDYTKVSRREQAYRDRMEAVIGRLEKEGGAMFRQVEPAIETPTAPRAPETVKKVDLEGRVIDTFQTEAELAGIRPEQGAMPLPKSARVPDAPVAALEGGRTDFEGIAAREASHGVPPQQGALRTALEPGIAEDPVAAAQQGFPGVAPARTARPAPVTDFHRGPDAALGEPPTQGAAIPPGAVNAPPPRGRGGTPEMGTQGPYADLLQAPKRDVALARGDRAAEGWKAKVSDRVRTEFNRMNAEIDRGRRKVDPFIREKKRQDANIGHLVEWFVQRERAVLRSAGLEVRNVGGQWRLFAGDTDAGLFDDIVERTTDAGRAGYASLTPEQQAALATVGETNRLFNETKLAHGSELRVDPDIEGDYFGRRVVSRTYEGEGGKVTLESGGAQLPSRRVGANRTKSRTVESVEDLQKRGFSIDDPWTTRAGVLRGKLLDAQDAYLGNNLKPLAVRDPGSTVGLAQVQAHPEFANQWFTPEIARRIQKGLEPRKSMVPWAEAINRYLTPLRASFDLSATFQQGLRLWLTDPKAAGEYWWTVARSLKDDSLYEGLLLRFDNEAKALGFENGMADLIMNDLRYTGGITGSEFTLPASLPNRLQKAGPVARKVGQGFQKSNEHFDRLLNAYRSHMALSQAKRLKDSGLEGDEFLGALRESNRAVNRMFGWTDSEPTALEQSLLFAPRYTRATAETLFNAVAKGGIKGNTARAHIALMLGEGAALVWLFNTMRGYETEFDPRDNNFLRFRNVAGRDITPFGTYNVLFRTVAQGIAGETTGEGLPSPGVFKRFVESKMSPAVGLLYWPVRQETYLGEPLTFDSWGSAADSASKLAPSFLPFGAQGLAEGDPVGAAIGGVGLSNTPVTPTEKRDFARDDVAREMFGAKYDDLSGAQKAQVNEQERVAGHQADADRNTLTRKTDRSQYLAATLGARAKLDFLAEALNSGRITGNEFRDQYRIIGAEMRGARDVVGSQNGGELDGWFDLYDQAEMPDGRMDYDLLEQLQAEYEAKHPGTEDKVLKLVGANDNATVREYREAQKLAREYYAIPAYRGMTEEESRTATRTLMAAQDMVSFGQARSMNHALRLIGQSDPEAMRLARRAQSVGPNRAREVFRRSHPEFARFYSDIAT